jgi:two-component sensor histidine kinase
MFVAIILSECYTQLKKYDIAERLCLRAIALTDSLYALKLDIINHRNVIQAYAALAEVYIGMQQFGKAERYMSKVYFYPNEPNYLIDLPRFELDRSRIDSGLGKSATALQHFQLYKRYSDSLSGIAKTVQLRELDLKYETEQKDKDLRIQSANIRLLQQQNLLQQTQSEKFHFIRDTMIGGLLLLAILCGLIFNRYRLKQQLVQQLGLQQQEILAKNSALEKLLRENEWLLREVHHRVKNNLQIVTALLNSQSAYLNDDKAVNAITESQSRVHAMSLIHQKLYKSQDVSAINMKEYTGDLVEYLRDTYQPGRQVYFDMRVDAVNIDVAQAVPIGLILNEVISNALKHAFVHTPDPRIRISENGI